MDARALFVDVVLDIIIREDRRRRREFSLVKTWIVRAFGDQPSRDPVFLALRTLFFLDEIGREWSFRLTVVCTSR